MSRQLKYVTDAQQMYTDCDITKIKKRVKRMETHLEEIDAKLDGIIDMITCLPPVQSQHYADTMKRTLENNKTPE